jgi:hypothetical protein
MSELRVLHPQVCKRLRRFSFLETVRLIAALGIMPEFHANTFRLEVLTHLAAVECNGATIPTHRDLTTLLNEFEKESPLISQEDPVEDVFIACVNTSHGTFRVFSGIFADGYFIVERLFQFLAAKETFPTFLETIETALTLLRLSDALVKRRSLTRNATGGGVSQGKLKIPSAIFLNGASDDVEFSEVDLNTRGISMAAIDEFVLHREERDAIQHQRMWASNLERRPLIRTESGILVVEPSTICRSLTRYMLERVQITKMGGWAEMFFQQENAGIFVNDVGRGLGIQRMESESPTPPAHLPPLYPFLGSFDLGKPVIMLTHTAPFEPAASEPDGIDLLGEKEVNAVKSYVKACTIALERAPEFSGGLVLVCCVGLGRSGGFVELSGRRDWVFYVATLQDWISLSRDPDCTALRLWKLGLQQQEMKRRQIALFNLAGLPALFAMWKRAGYSLFHPEMDINSSGNILSVDCVFGAQVRVQAKIKNDVHYVRSHDQSKCVCLERLHPNSFFLDEEEARCYGDIEAVHEGRLVGCVETRSEQLFWILVPKIEASESHMDILFQLWECVLQWLARSLKVIEREFPQLGAESVEFRIDLPDFPRWDISSRPGGSFSVDPISVEADRSEQRATLTISEGILARFNQAENVAERDIIGALLKGVAQLSEGVISPEKIQALALEIAGGNDARFFHIVESKHLETQLRTHRMARPLFVPEEDSAMVRVGLADLVGRPPSAKLEGKERCQKFLQEAVEKVWERIEQSLRTFDRSSVVMACFQAITEISRDTEHFDMTTRSLLALHSKGEETNAFLRSRRAMWQMAEFANRLVIETAQYTAPTAGGRRFNQTEHGRLLAEFELLLTLAHHRDAIAYDFIKPQLMIFPRGDISVDARFYEQVLKKYHSRRLDQHTEEAAKSYDSYFPARSQNEQERSSPETIEQNGFDEAFIAEFGFSVEQMVKVLEKWRQVAIKTKQPGGLVREGEMIWMLTRVGEMTTEEAERFLTTFTLPIRSAWDRDLPTRCRKEDVYPWRFRRRLSVLMRPLIQVGTDPRVWAVWVPAFDKAARYVTQNIAQGRFPDQFFSTPKMRSYIGSRVDRRGHNFAVKVRDELERLGFSTQLEIKMTALGSPKQPDLGDVDVLAWRPTGRTVCAIECKSLTAALTVREIIQRLEDFRGDERREDSLGKHVRRTKWLETNRAKVARVTGLPAVDLKVIGLLVCSDLVPMQFFQEMHFPAEHVLSFDDLKKIKKIARN